MHLSIYYWVETLVFILVQSVLQSQLYFNTTCNKYNVSKQMGGLLTGNLCRTYFWSDLHALSIYLLTYVFWYKLQDQMFYEKPYIVFYKCKCAKFLSSIFIFHGLFHFACIFCQFEIWSSPYISLSTLFALICYHWSRKWQSRYIEHLIIHTRLVWMYSIKINRIFFF